MEDINFIIEMDSLERECESEEKELTKLMLVRQGLAKQIKYRTLSDAIDDFLPKAKRDESLLNSVKWNKKHGTRLQSFLQSIGMKWTDFVRMNGFKPISQPRHSGQTISSIDDVAIIFQKYLRSAGVKNCIDKEFWQKPGLVEAYDFVINKMEWMDFVKQYGGIPETKLKRCVRDSWTEDDLKDKAMEIIRSSEKMPSYRKVMEENNQLHRAIQERYGSWRKFVINVLGIGDDNETDI